MSVVVQRYRLRDSVKRTCPIESSMRWKGVISRQVYNVPGPNSLRHIDTHQFNWMAIGDTRMY